MKATRLAFVFVLSFLVICLLSACSKPATNNSNIPNATWTFKGITYKEVHSGGSYSTLAFEDSTAGIPNFLTVVFPGTTLPVTSGNYMISTVNSPSGGKIFIQFTMSNGDYYSPTGGNGNQTVNVNVNNGKLTVSGSNIEMVGSGSDSSALTFNVHEI